jgi:hypothetical protein
MQALGTFLVTAHIAGMTDQNWQLITGVVLMLVPVVWGMFNHTQKNAVAIVAAMPGTVTSPSGQNITLADPHLAAAAAANRTDYSGNSPHAP